MNYCAHFLFSYLTYTQSKTCRPHNKNNPSKNRVFYYNPSIATNTTPCKQYLKSIITPNLNFYSSLFIAFAQYALALSLKVASLLNVYHLFLSDRLATHSKFRVCRLLIPENSTILRSAQNSLSYTLHKRPEVTRQEPRTRKHKKTIWYSNRRISRDEASALKEFFSYLSRSRDRTQKPVKIPVFTQFKAFATFLAPS